MKVAILGAGNAGTALAAVSAIRGHPVCMWSRNMNASDDATTRSLSTQGKVMVTAQVRCESQMKSAIDGAEVIVICVPAYAQHDLIEQLVPLVSKGQMLLLCPAPSLSPLLLEQGLAQRGIHNLVAGAATSLLTAKLSSRDEVQITTMRAGVGLATVRPEDYETALKICEDLFGISFVQLEGPLALALAYVTPVVHSAMVLGNLSRVELQETWGQFECTTPSIARLCEALDAERMALARHLKISIPTLVEHCVISFGIPAKDYYDFCLEISKARNGGPPGPTSLDQRYVTEDLPFGLVFFSALAKREGIAVPLTDACISMMSVACNHHFSEENSMLSGISSLQD